MTRSANHYTMTPRQRPRNANTVLKLKYFPERDPDKRPPVTLKPRTCLRCDKTFPSEGPQNRLCASCLGSLVGVEAMEPATIRPKREFVEVT